MQKPLLNGVSTHLNLMVVMKILIISMISTLKWVKLSTNQVIKYSYERDRELNEQNSRSNAILFNKFFVTINYRQTYGIHMLVALRSIEKQY
jgi:hypothetical protein